MTDEKPITTIFIADDHPLVRCGLQALLQAQTDYQIAGEAGDGQAALRQIERLRPSIVISDITMPGLNGLDMIGEIHKRLPTCRVILLTMHINESFIREAWRNGAAAYVDKDSSPEEVLVAIREVVEGRRYLSPTVARHFGDIDKPSDETEKSDPYHRLTPREREVFQLVTEGKTSGEIGKQLFISPRTVEIHRSNLLRKLGVRTQRELVTLAVRRGILQV